MNKNKLIVIVFLGIFLVPQAFGSYINTQMIVQPVGVQNTFNPVVKEDFTYDVNKNKIHDHFEAQIKAGFESDFYTAIATFNGPMTKAVRDNIKAVGGEIVSSWSVIYGAAIRIRGYKINALASLPEIN
ncbi:MAG TPA: hypothetical protein VMZ29_10085, partial [Candidatus Bathyarchaeia archaeon]|nr:hypothetical protein [Candidatus Bathyarchaeia archaeon]